MICYSESEGLINCAVSLAAFQCAAGCPVPCEAVWLRAGALPVPAGRAPAQPRAHRVRGHALVPSAWDTAGLPPVSQGRAGEGSLALHHLHIFLSKSLQSLQCHQMQGHVSSLFSQCTIKLLQHKNLLWTWPCPSCVLTASVDMHEPFVTLSPTTFMSSPLNPQLYKICLRT